MGGTIAVVIREEDGKIHKMARWTNSLPYFIRNMKFVNGDKQHLSDYLKVFYDMVEEYNAIKESGGDFGIKMCDVYVPNSGHIAPIGYGLVVIDYQTNQILHCQGYSALDALYPFEVNQNRRLRDDDEEAAREFIDSKRVSYIDAFKREKKLSGRIKLSIEYIEEDGKITIRPKNGENLDLYYIHGYVLDMSPWEVTRFEEGEKKELERFKIAVKKIGFEISEDDEKLWADFAEEHSDYVE